MEEAGTNYFVGQFAFGDSHDEMDLRRDGPATRRIDAVLRHRA